MLSELSEAAQIMLSVVSAGVLLVHDVPFVDDSKSIVQGFVDQFVVAPPTMTDELEVVVCENQFGIIGFCCAEIVDVLAVQVVPSVDEANAPVVPVSRPITQIPCALA